MFNETEEIILGYFHSTNEMTQTEFFFYTLFPRVQGEQQSDSSRKAQAVRTLP